ncbi:hypothetical protein E1B28_013546 [Marasmius oreades]|uniref:Uncharacterized protein n=1 Tax=Marasmius oreades TaxID=181124 RepID=A0A9P7RQM5_9AGAR|nr:uncharacterized protein E1B28_013546 [Marasmius oreades]KAG7087593.1 hypothetical protein E1B28_013546 [Marasmius oreades]
MEYKVALPTRYIPQPSTSTLMPLRSPVSRAQAQLNASVNSGAPMTPKTVRNALVAMGFLGASFAGFYYALRERDRRKREAGVHEQFELTMEQAQKRGHLPTRLNESSSVRDIRDLLPVREHDAKHVSVQQAQRMGAYGDGQRIEQPAPQPQKSDGTGVASKKT